MRAAQALNIQLAALVAVYGLQRVQKALARIDDGSVEKLDELGVSKYRPETSETGGKTRRKKCLDEVIKEADVDPRVRLLVHEIGLAYEQRTFLPDLWRVRKFLESEGVDASKLRSRSAALRKVVDVLARLSEQQLQDLLVESKGGRGQLATLTDHILGTPTTRGTTSPAPTAAPVSDARRTSPGTVQRPADTTASRSPRTSSAGAPPSAT